MIELLAALSIVTQGPPPPATPPTDLRLEAFRAACVPHRRDIEATAVMMAADGWAIVPDDDHPELMATMGKARAEAVDLELQMTADFTIWARAFGDRKFHVVLNRIHAVLREEKDDDGDGEIQEWEERDEMTLLGCGLWDFDTAERIPPAAVDAWVGTPAVETFDLPGEMIGGTWNLYHMLPGTADVKVGFIPEGSDFEARTGFSGVAITMSSAPLDADEPDTTPQAASHDDIDEDAD